MSELYNALLINALAAPAFIALVSLVREPARQRAMAIMVAMAGGLCAVPPFATLGFAVGAAVAVAAYLGLRSYRWIGLAWLIHGAWDLVLHTKGVGLMGLGTESTLGCAIFDPLIALWFFAGAPSVWSFVNTAREASQME